MSNNKRYASVCGVLFCLGVAAVSAAEPIDRESAAARIVGAALVDSQAYDKLTWLTDRIGHRLSGSAALDHPLARIEPETTE